RRGSNGSWAMASSRKPRSAEVLAAVGRAMPGLEGKRIVVGLSGGVDSVVLLHALSRAVPGVRAAHINHGLSPNARRWAEFCRRLCRRLGVPLTVRRVRVAKRRSEERRVGEEGGCGGGA